MYASQSIAIYDFEGKLSNSSAHDYNYTTTEWKRQLDFPPKNYPLKNFTYSSGNVTADVINLSNTDRSALKTTVNDTKYKIEQGVFKATNNDTILYFTGTAKNSNSDYKIVY